MARTKGTARVASSGRQISRPSSYSSIKRRDRTPKDSSPKAPAAGATRTRRRRRAGADPWLPKRKPKKSSQPRTPPPTHFTCRICAEEKPVDMFIKWVTSLKRHVPGAGVPYECVAHLCRNPRQKNDPVCIECIGQSMSARLDAVGARRVGIGCLETDCQTPWDFTYIIKYFPSGPQLEKYNNSMLSVWMEDLNPKLVHCINEDCSAVGMIDIQAPGYPQVSCNDCSIRMCAHCKVPWHSNVTCSEYAAKNVNEKMSDPEKDTLQLMQTKDGKRCPNCYMVIEKDGGCDSMFCMGCKKYFNWQTAASAVLGAKKAAPTIPGQGQWHYVYQNRNVPCETDAIEKAERAKKKAEKKRKRDENGQVIPLRRSARRAAMNNPVAAST